MVKFNTRQKRLRMVDIEINIISARYVSESVPEGLWQTLKRKSEISGKPFPVGSKIVMVMYVQEGKQCSGAVHWDELPSDVQASLKTVGDCWQEKQ